MLDRTHKVRRKKSPTLNVVLLQQRLLPLSPIGRATHDFQRAILYSGAGECSRLGKWEGWERGVLAEIGSQN